jgi:hypothetical protein
LELLKLYIKENFFPRVGYIATNIGKEKTGYEIVKKYRKRATQQQAIEELKN